MYCKACGKKIEAGTVRCRYCGREVDALSGGTGFWDLVQTKDSGLNSSKPAPAPTPKEEPVQPGPNKSLKNEHSEQYIPVPKASAIPRSWKIGCVVALAVLGLSLGVQFGIIRQIKSVRGTVEPLEQQLQETRDRMEQLEEKVAAYEAPTGPSLANASPAPTVQPPLEADKSAVETTPKPSVTPPVNTEPEIQLEAEITSTEQVHLRVEAADKTLLSQLSADAITWWINEGEGDEPCVDENNQRRIGKEIDYPFSYLRGNSGKGLFCKVNTEEREYISEPIYILKELISIQREGRRLIPDGAAVFFYAAEAEDVQLTCYWERCENGQSWEKIDAELGEDHSLELETETGETGYRFIIKNGDTLLAMSEYPAEQ